ncbi:MAG: hypothetical protein U0572_12400 [Phycisphaerales bacterium]
MFRLRNNRDVRLSRTVRARRRAPLRGVAACCLAATAAGAFLTTNSRVDGCGGAPPPAVCGKTTTLTKAGPAIFPVAFFGGIVMFPVTVGVAAFGNGCPAPLTTTISLTIGCAPPPGAVGGIVIPTPAPGAYPALVPVFIPPGPPRICTVAGSATTTWSDGSTTTGFGDTKFCVVEASPLDPTLPRLDMQLVTPSIQTAHPGDQRVHLFRFTNNDPSESVTVNLVADSEQTARLGAGTGFVAGSGEGLFSISDPGNGDNFPIGWVETLGPDGCLSLPPNPMGFPIPHITKTLTLLPGESRVVGVAHRSWPMCGCGSCCESRIDVNGTWSDGTAALACGGAGLYVDCSVPPDYDCADGGSAGHLAAALPWQLISNLQNSALPGLQGTARIVESHVIANGVFPGLPGPSTNWDGFRGRMEAAHQGAIVAQANQMVNVSAIIDVSATAPGVSSAYAQAIPAFPPSTLPQEWFWLDLRHQLQGPAVPPTLSSFFDVFTTVELDGISGGLHRRAKILPSTVNLQPISATQFSIEFTAQFPALAGFPNAINQVNLHIDASTMNIGLSAPGSICPSTNHDCLSQGSAGCSDSVCCTSVCTIDPFCCDVQWDGICVDEADQLCYAQVYANDECGHATPIGSGTTPFSTVGATTSAAALDPSCDEGFGLSFVDDVWFTYDSTVNGSVIVSTCGAADYDTRLAVYNGCPGSGGSLVACNDDAPGCAGLTSKVTFSGTCGARYWIRVGGYSGSGTGAITISTTGTCQAPCPTDLNGDGTTNGADLAMVLGGWGSSGVSDLDGDGTTNGADLAILLGGWGPCATP